jgi:hypothetical protein
MPRSRIAILAALLAWPLIGSAKQVSAITDYLKPIVSKIASDPNAGGWTWETNGNGGYLLRMAIDVTGDGVPEQFITSSLTAVKQVAEWTVYDLNKAGEMRPYLRSIRLPADSVWPASNDSDPSLVYVGAPDRERELASDEKSYPVYHFKFTFPEINETLAYASADEAIKIRPSDPSQLPKLQAILLADYLTKQDAKWADVTEWKLDANDCFFRPEDTEIALNNTDFTPQAALVMLGLAQQAPQNGNSPTPRTSAPASVPTVAQPRPPKAHESNPALPETSGKPVTSTPWGVILILIVAVIGLAWLLLKKRN